MSLTGRCESVYNYSKTGWYKKISVTGRDTTSLLLERGDLILFDEFLYYANHSGDSLWHVEATDSTLYLNGVLTAMAISDRYDMLPLINSLSENDKKQLRSLTFSENIPDTCLSFVQSVAALNPEAGLQFSRFNKEAQEVLALFHPKWVWLSEAEQQDLGLLAGLTNLELLMFQPVNNILTESLPALPGLTQLILSEPEDQDVFQEGFLAENPQIRSVVMMNIQQEQVDFLNSCKGLKNLVITGIDEGTIDAGMVSGFTDLEVLGLIASDLSNTGAIDSLKSLKWLMLPSILSQEDFNSVIGSQSGLEVLELIGNDEGLNLEVLQQLPELKALTVTEVLGDSATPLLLANLHYLSLPGEVMKDTAYVASLKAALPGCKVVANTGLCLGSGWLLLIFPLLALLVVLRRRTTVRKAES